MESKQEYIYNYENPDDAKDVSKQNSHSYNQPQVTINHINSYNKNNNANSSEVQHYIQEIRPTKEITKGFELKVASLQTDLKDANTRHKDEEEEIKELRKQLEAEITKSTDLDASCVRLVDGMKINEGEYSDPVQDGLPHGEGEWVDKWSEAIYKGTWRFGKRERLHIGEDK